MIHRILVRLRNRVRTGSAPAITILRYGRDIGITEFLHSQAPWGVILLFAMITQLGDFWFLFLLGGMLYIAGGYVPYWGIERHRGMFVFALVAAYTTLIAALKNLFMLPRPVGASEPPALRWIPGVFAGLFTSAATATGSGFPSGHALGSTMIWGGLALVLEAGTFRKRVGIASGVVVLISISRLVLGVHYLVDVLAGILIGVLALGLLYWLADSGTDPEYVLLVAVATGGIGLLIRVSFTSVAAFGGAVGGWLVWRSVADSTPAHPSNSWELLASIAVIVLAGGIFGVMYLFPPGLPFLFLGAVLVGGIAVGAPILGERLDSSRTRK